MAPIQRKTWVDDDGTGTTGTIINNARLQQDIYDPIDAAIAPPWTPIAFNAANFVAIGGGSITITAASQQQNAYMLVGTKLMIWLFGFNQITITGAVTEIRYTLPFVPSQTTRAALQTYSVGNLSAWSVATAVAGNTYVSLFSNLAGTAWGVGAGAFCYGNMILGL